MTVSGWPNAPEPTLPANAGAEIIPVFGDIASDPTPKASSRLRLSSLADVKRQLRLIFIEARNGELATGEATRLTYILTQLANLIADNELAERVSRLESGRD